MSIFNRKIKEPVVVPEPPEVTRMKKKLDVSAKRAYANTSKLNALYRANGITLQIYTATHGGGHK